MSHPFLHPVIEVLLERVAQAFTRDDVYLVVDRHLLFVCGGSVKPAAPPATDSLRKRFLRYADTELPNFRVFLAEDATRDIFESSAPTFLNLAEFENFIAEFADCVVLFPESPGSLAEIGFFAAFENIRRKLLVANDIAEQGVDSFINNGPLALVNQTSEFRTVIQLDRSCVDFSPIKQRLRRFPAKRRHRFEFSPYATLAPVARFGLILEIVSLFGPISLSGLHYIVTILFGDTNLDELKHILSLTVAVGYIRRIGILEDNFLLNPGTETMFVLDSTETGRLRLSILDFYHRHVPTIYGLAGIVPS